MSMTKTTLTHWRNYMSNLQRPHNIKPLFNRNLQTTTFVYERQNTSGTTYGYGATISHLTLVVRNLFDET